MRGWNVFRLSVRAVWLPEEAGPPHGYHPNLHRPRLYLPADQRANLSEPDLPEKGPEAMNKELREAVITDLTYMARIWRIFGIPDMEEPAND